MTLLHSPIKNEVEQIRGSLGCSQEMLARVIGVHTRTVVRWEHGVSQPHHLAREKIRKIEKLIDKIYNIFEPGDAVQWLNTSNKSFSSHTPLEEIIYSENGIEKVMDLLSSIEWGIVT